MPNLFSANFGRLFVSVSADKLAVWVSVSACHALDYYKAVANALQFLKQFFVLLWRCKSGLLAQPVHACRSVLANMLVSF